MLLLLLLLSMSLLQLLPLLLPLPPPPPLLLLLLIFLSNYCRVWFVQLRGNIAVIERGEVTFATKARRAMKARFEFHA